MNDTELDAPSSPRLSALRDHCRGVAPLDARLTPWMQQIACDTARVRRLMKDHESPLHVHVPSGMAENASRLARVAEDRGIDFRIFFARKANKYLAYIDQARELGLGVDTASENELQQCLDLAVRGEDLMYTAAIKDVATIALAISTQTTIVIDNADELDTVAKVLTSRPTSVAQLALRLRGFSFPNGIHRSRFGVDLSDAAEFIYDADLHHGLVASRFCWNGVHFHLDGYESSERIAALRQAIPIVNQLRQAGHPAQFIDMGGGFPVCYLQHQQQWDALWQRIDEQLTDPDATPVTANRINLGRVARSGSVTCQVQPMYPYWQAPVGHQWLANILDDHQSGQSLAELFRDSEIELRCEPGRYLMDGCGMTLAEVMFRKHDQDGHWLIGLKMNRTNCQTTAADFCVDPILIPSGEGERCEPGEGYFVGAYCMEDEFLTPRRMRLDQGVAVGDIVAFPNTAGYLMHFLESRSHQFDLPENITLPTSNDSAINRGW